MNIGNRGNSESIHEPTKVFRLSNEMFVPTYTIFDLYVMRGGLMLQGDELRRRGAVPGIHALWIRPSAPEVTQP